MKGGLRLIIHDFPLFSSGILITHLNLMNDGLSSTILRSHECCVKRKVFMMNGDVKSQGKEKGNSLIQEHKMTLMSDVCTICWMEKLFIFLACSSS